jgi:ankyrin repeat protein
MLAEQALQDAIRAIRDGRPADAPALGVKKICTELKKLPAYASVNTKQVREALAQVDRTDALIASRSDGGSGSGSGSGSVSGGAGASPSQPTVQTPAATTTVDARGGKRQGAGSKKHSQLLDAVRAGNVSKVRRLLDGGSCDVNAVSLRKTDYEGIQIETTPLQQAIFYQQLAAAQLLVDRGANVNCRTGLRRGPTAERGMKIRPPFSPLQVAVQRGNVEFVQFLLAAGADVAATPQPPRSGKSRDRHTAFHEACEKGFADIAEVLVRAGFDPRTPDGEGSTGLDLALDRSRLGESADDVPAAVRIGPTQDWANLADPAGTLAQIRALYPLEDTSGLKRTIAEDPLFARSMNAASSGDLDELLRLVAEAGGQEFLDRVENVSDAREFWVPDSGLITRGALLMLTAALCDHIGPFVHLLPLVSQYEPAWDIAFSKTEFSEALTKHLDEQLYTDAEKASTKLRFAVGDRVVVRMGYTQVCGEVYGGIVCCEGCWHTTCTAEEFASGSRPEEPGTVVQLWYKECGSAAPSVIPGYRIDKQLTYRNNGSWWKESRGWAPYLIARDDGILMYVFRDAEALIGDATGLPVEPTAAKWYSWPESKSIQLRFSVGDRVQVGTQTSGYGRGGGALEGLGSFYWAMGTITETWYKEQGKDAFWTTDRVGFACYQVRIDPGELDGDDSLVYIIRDDDTVIRRRDTLELTPALVRAASTNDLPELERLIATLKQPAANQKCDADAHQPKCSIELLDKLTDPCQMPIFDNDAGETTHQGQQVVPTSAVNALLAAIHYGHIDSVKLLLDHGADPTVKGSLGFPPVILATAMGDLPMLNLLLSLSFDDGRPRVDVNAYSNTAPEYRSWSGLANLSYTALWFACRLNYYALAHALLGAGADPTLRILHMEGEGTVPEEIEDESFPYGTPREVLGSVHDDDDVKDAEEHLKLVDALKQQEAVVDVNKRRAAAMEAAESGGLDQLSIAMADDDDWEAFGIAIEDGRLIQQEMRETLGYAPMEPEPRPLLSDQLPELFEEDAEDLGAVKQELSMDDALALQESPQLVSTVGRTTDAGDGTDSGAAPAHTGKEDGEDDETKQFRAVLKSIDLSHLYDRLAAFSLDNDSIAQADDDDWEIFEVDVSDGRRLKAAMCAAMGLEP